MNKHTPGPWFLIDADGADFTAIATIPKLMESYDSKHEVLGASEWLRAEEPDLRLMAAAPEMLTVLEDIIACKYHLPDWLEDQIQEIIDKAEHKHKTSVKDDPRPLTGEDLLKIYKELKSNPDEPDEVKIEGDYAAAFYEGYQKAIQVLESTKDATFYALNKDIYLHAINWLKQHSPAAPLKEEK